MIEAVLFLALGPFVQVETDSSDSVWVKLAREHVSAYELSRARDPNHSLERVDPPVTQHVQSVRGNATGSVYLWRDDTGRPVAVCDVFFLPRSGDSFHLYDEWHSLTAEPMIARWGQETRWTPQEPGLTWNAVPDASPPATNQNRRNLQLRQLSRRFTASIIDNDDQRFELRMLPTPIYTFETTNSEESLGGGLFAFCQGNDPEVLLLIEARLSDDAAEKVRWEFAAAELSNRPQFVDLDGETVWKADPPRFSNTGKHTGGPRETVTIPHVENDN